MPEGKMTAEQLIDAYLGEVGFARWSGGTTPGKPPKKSDIKAWVELAREWGADVNPHDETQVSFRSSKDAEKFYADVERELSHLVLRTGFQSRTDLYLRTK